MASKTINCGAGRQSRNVDSYYIAMKCIRCRTDGSAELVPNGVCNLSLTFALLLFGICIGSHKYVFGVWAMASIYILSETGLSHQFIVNFNFVVSLTCESLYYRTVAAAQQ